MKSRFRKAFIARPRFFILVAEPPTQPAAGVNIDRTVGFADRSQTKVVGPADQNSIELFHHALRSLCDGTSPGFFADGATDALHSFLRRECLTKAPSCWHLGNSFVTQELSPVFMDGSNH